MRGGKNADTTSQHIIIEGVAKQYGLNIVGQEAEIERHGFEILMKNIKGKFKNKEYNSIIIASTNILSLRILRQIKDSRIKVYSALEGKFLS